MDTREQQKHDRIAIPSSPNLTHPARPAWMPLLGTSLCERALEMLHLVADRLRDPAFVESVAQQAKQQSRYFVSWGGNASLSGFASLALLNLFLARSFPGEGWEELAHRYLRLAAQRSQQYPLVIPGLYGGSSGLAMVLAAFCEEEPRYQKTLETLNEQVSEQSLDLLARTANADLSMEDYDVINGASGILGYLISLPSPTPRVQDALNQLLHYLTWLGSEKEPGHPNWFIAPEQIFEAMRPQYPEGQYNLGLAHGIPGPLAALCLAWQAGYRIPGQRKAIERICNWIRDYAIADEWGINWPAAIPSACPPTLKGQLAPTRAAWCYGAPGIASALWLAGEALADDTLRRLAAESLEAVCRRPIEARNSVSPTLCHGDGGLLAICLRFAQVSQSQVVKEQIPLLVTRILAACSPDYPLGVRDEETTGNFVDDPGFLTGAVGVALVLLAASTEVEPTWNRFLMIA